MAARSIASLTVSFGMVAIPVKLYSATEASRQISFNLLHKDCGALLTRALKESERCAVGRWAARGKQYIVMIRPVANGLVMQQLLYSTEVRSINEIDIPKIEVKETELKLARQLIDQQSSDTFDAA